MPLLGCHQAEYAWHALLATDVRCKQSHKAWTDGGRTRLTRHMSLMLATNALKLRLCIDSEDIDLEDFKMRDVIQSDVV